MKILLTMNVPYFPPYGGASKAARLLMEQFVQAGHEVLAVVPARGPASQMSVTQLHAMLAAQHIRCRTIEPGIDHFVWNGVMVYAALDVALLRTQLIRRIQAFQPDVVIVSTEDPSQTLLEAAITWAGGRVVYLVQTPTFLPFGPQSFFPSKIRTHLLAQTSAIITVSKFVQQYVAEWGGFTAQCCYMPVYGTGPFPDLGRFDAGLVTMVNPCQVKGITLFLELARKFPTIPFAAVPTWGATAADRAELAALPNVHVRTPEVNFDHILAQTRILLMPSLWQEAFGCTAVEAMLRGIPVLASNTGGLAEAKLGTDFLLPVEPITRFSEMRDDQQWPVPVIPPQDIQPWFHALDLLTSDAQCYSQQSQAAKAASTAFVAGLSSEPFIQLLQRVATGERLIAHTSPDTSTHATVKPGTSTALTQLSPDQRARLINRLREQAAARTTAEAPTIQPVPHTPFMPLSFAQQRLWFIDQLTQDGAAYTMPMALRFTGTLNLDQLARSMQVIVERHAVLRSNILMHDGEPVQIIAPTRDLVVDILDLRSMHGGAQEAEVQRHIAAAAQHPFDVSRDLLLRAQVLRLSDYDHVVIVCMHHIVADGWSLDLFLQECTSLYTQFVTGRPGTLPDLPIQYVDYAVWQRTRLQGTQFEQQLQYWRQQLAALPMMELPLDYPRPAVQLSNGATQRVVLPLHLTNAVKALSHHEDVTLFMVLLTAFQVLLHRYSGQDDIVVGSPVTSRTHVELEPLIGCFVNMLVLRSDLSAAPTFRVALKRVKDVCLSAYAHQDIPFEQLVEALQPERTMSHTPLFQVVFVMQGPPPSMRTLPNLTCSPMQMTVESAKFDLTFSIGEKDQQLTVGCEYRTDLFTSATIERMLRHFQELLIHIVAAPDQSIAELSLMSASEQQQIIDASQATAAFSNDCLHTLFAQQAAMQPDSVALIYEDQEIRYGELNRRANQLAHHLQAIGIGPETRVGLLLERSPDLIIAIIGVLKAGAAYVPIDTGYPAERIAFILEDSHAELLITHTAAMAHLPELTLPVVALGSIAEILATLPDDTPPGVVEPDNLAYIIYTSGSTGRPKGVMVSHANVTRLLEATQAQFQFGPHDVWTLFHSCAFDFSVWEIWGALRYGGRLIVVPFWVSRTPDAFYQLVCEQQVTVLNQTPSAFRQFIYADEHANDLAPLALRLVIFGGEALDLSSLKPWFERHTDDHPQLVNMYGITETTVHVTQRRISMPDVFAATGSMIGAPIDDLELYILTPGMQLAPVNVPGELYVGGAGVARGYLGRPGLTAERFIPHPFSATPGARLYRTGDLARYRSTYDIEYLGRIDQQVKMYGYRIELGEIAATLLTHPLVRECVVVVRADTPTTKQLIAYVVCADTTTGSELMAGDLRAFLQRRLPEYMLPVAFVPLAAMPLTVNGKLDRLALPEPSRARSTDDSFTPPRTADEELLAAIWQRVLGAARVGVYDNFFSSGGDSIRSVQIVAEARAHGLELSVQHLFQHQTIDELARHLHRAHHHHSTPTAPMSLLTERERARLPVGVEDAYPLTKLQAGMVYHSMLTPETSIYHDLYGFQLRAPFSQDGLRAATELITQRHPILRTSFDLSSGDEPLQYVHSTSHIPITITDLRDLDEESQITALERWYEAEQSERFNWQQAPLLRMFIHRRSSDTFQVTLSFHHAILDGWSVAALMTEWLTAYANHLDTATVLPGPDLAATFRDAVALERQASADPDVRAYWAGKIADATPILLPRLQTTPPSSAQQVHGHTVAIPWDLSSRLKTLARQLGVPLKSILLAAHLCVLRFMSGSSDVLSGFITNSRPEIRDGEKVTGLFLNTLPFRLHLNGGTWRDIIQHTVAAERELLPFRFYPYADIVQLAAGTALFETAFNFIHFHIYQQAQEAAHIEILDWHFAEETNLTLVANFGLSLVTSDVRLNLAYNAHVISEAQIHMIGAYYLRTLAALADNPDARYETANLLPVEEYCRFIEEWNATHHPYPQVPLPARIAAQASQTPDALALVADGQRLNYRELNQRANQLAHYLQSFGILAEDRVGICMERSADMLIALLAVLKVGATYVPLDPHYPSERLRFIAEDARLNLLLSNVPTPWLSDSTSFVRCIDLPAAHAQIIQYPDGDLNVPVAFDSLAYIIHTSGSTGQPKGVMISHRSLMNFLTGMLSQPGITRNDTLLAVTTLSFDIAGLELFLPLLVGASVVIARREESADGIALADYLEREQVTIMQATPATWHLLLDAGWSGGRMRKILCGGEALPWELSRRLLETGAELWNMYGPTETTIWSTVSRIQQHDPLISIGRPIANTQVFILDDLLLPVPIGVIGKLYISGDGLARGYVNQPALTAGRFIPNPFSTTSGSRLYDTGDIARYHPDGQLEHLGRADQQVKIRGFRIELQEIEDVLGRHPALNQVAVLAREDTPGNQRLVAYIVLQDSSAHHIDTVSEATIHTSALATELLAHLRRYLPEYMLPSAFVTLTSFPYTTNGKVDRKALPRPEHYSILDQKNYVAPRSPAEQVVAAVWKQVLAVDTIGIHDQFAALGGHSLLAMRVLMHLRRIFQVEPSLRALFDAPTVAGMVMELERLWGDPVVVDEIAQTYWEIEQLSDQQAQALLTDDMAST